MTKKMVKEEVNASEMQRLRTVVEKPTPELRRISKSLWTTAVHLILAFLLTLITYWLGLVLKLVCFNLFVLQALQGFLGITYFLILFALAVECIFEWTRIW